MRGIQVFSLFPVFLSSFFFFPFFSSLFSFLSSLFFANFRGGGRPLCPRTEASLSLLGGQDRNISSIFPHFLVVSHISSNCLNFLPYFGLPGGRFAHQERPWLRHCSTPCIRACLLPTFYWKSIIQFQYNIGFYHVYSSLCRNL